MRRLLVASVFAALFAALPALTAFAADNPWLGTWKLDPAQSKSEGGTLVFTKSANGLYHYSNGSRVSYDFGIDGKEYKSVYNHTVNWTAAGDNAWDLVRKRDGAVVATEHFKISPDGKTLTVTSSGTEPDGTSFNHVNAYTRASGSHGLIGKWQSTKVDLTAANTLIVSSPSEGVLRWEVPAYKAVVEGKPDGTDLQVTGPKIPSGLTLSIKLVSPYKQIYKEKLGGELVETTIETLSADGKTLTDVVSHPGQRTERSTLVYTKQ